MLDLTPASAKHLLQCMEAVEALAKGQKTSILHQSQKMAEALMLQAKGQRVRRAVILLDPSDQTANDKSLTTLKELAMVDGKAQAKLPANTDYTRLLQGIICLFYPRFFVERARSKGEVPELSSLKLLSFDYDGGPEDGVIQLSFSMVDSRLSTKDVARYCQHAMLLDASTVTLYSNEEALLARLKDVLSMLSLGEGEELCKQPRQETGIQQFTMKVKGLDGFYLAFSQLLLAGVKLDKKSEHFNEIGVTLLSRELDKKWPRRDVVAMTLACLPKTKVVTRIVMESREMLARLNLMSEAAKLVSDSDEKLLYADIVTSGGRTSVRPNYYNPRFLNSPQTTEFNRYDGQKWAEDLKQNHRSFEI